MINYSASSSAADALVAELDQAHGKGTAFAIQADISSDEGRTKLAKETLEHTGGQLGSLIHNAAVGQLDQSLEKLVR